MNSKNPLPRYIPGKEKKITQKMYNSIERRNGFKILVGGYDYSKIKDFGSYPIEMVNPSDGNKKYINQNTIMPKGMKIPPGSSFIDGAKFSKNTHAGSGCSFSGAVFANNLIGDNSCSFANCVCLGSVKTASSTQILGNTTFRGTFETLSDCVISGFNNNFLLTTSFGHNLKLSGANLFGKTSVGNNPVIIGCSIKGDFTTGARTNIKDSMISTGVLSFNKGAHITGKTTFENPVSLKGAFVGKGVVFSASNNDLHDCTISSGVDIPSETKLTGVLYNQYHKGKEAKRGLIGDNCEIIKSTIVNSDIGVNGYFSGSEVSYSKIDGGVYDGINKNTLDNVTFIDSNDPDNVIDLTEVILKGRNKTGVHVNINVHDNYNVTNLPLPLSNVEVGVNALYLTSISGISEIDASHVDGIVSFSGQCEFKEFNDISDLGSIEWLECSDSCTTTTNGIVGDELLINKTSDEDINSIVNESIGPHNNNREAKVFATSFIEDVGVELGVFDVPGASVNTEGTLDIELEGMKYDLTGPVHDLPPVDSYGDCEQMVGELENAWSQDKNILVDEISEVQKRVASTSPGV
jgi:hypothetical protein